MSREITFRSFSSNFLLHISYRTHELEEELKELKEKVCTCKKNGKYSFERKGKEMFYLTTHSTHFIYGYMASDI